MTEVDEVEEGEIECKQISNKDGEEKREQVGSGLLFLGFRS